MKTTQRGTLRGCIEFNSEAGPQRGVPKWRTLGGPTTAHRLLTTRSERPALRRYPNPKVCWNPTQRGGLRGSSEEEDPRRFYDGEAALSDPLSDVPHPCQPVGIYSEAVSKSEGLLEINSEGGASEGDPKRRTLGGSMKAHRLLTTRSERPALKRHRTFQHNSLRATSISCERKNDFPSSSSIGRA